MHRFDERLYLVVIPKQAAHVSNSTRNDSVAQQCAAMDRSAGMSQQCANEMP